MPGALIPRKWPARLAVFAAVVILGVAVAAGVRWRDTIQFELGYAYQAGSLHGWTAGFSRDYGKAAHWLRQAAAAGHPRAQYMLGILYAHGRGVAKDEARAAGWFIRAARQAYAPSLYHLGWMYHKGDGVPQDYRISMQLMEQAARQGMAAAKLALGAFYEHGEGVGRDPGRALQWYTLAAQDCETRPAMFDNAMFTARAVAARDRLKTPMPAAGPKPAKAGQAGWSGPPSHADAVDVRAAFWTARRVSWKRASCNRVMAASATHGDERFQAI